MMDSGQINKIYSVVQFISDSTYSEIPTTWLVKKGNKQLCWWPPRTANAAILIANCSPPNMELWNQYEVDIIKSCCKYLYMFIFLLIIIIITDLIIYIKISIFSYSLQHLLNLPEKVLQMLIIKLQTRKNWDEVKDLMCQTVVLTTIVTMKTMQTMRFINLKHLKIKVRVCINYKKYCLLIIYS